MPSQVTTAREAVDEPEADVIDFGTARERQLLTRYRARARSVLTQNREAIQRLYETGMIFTRHGTRVGRDLLQAHRNLLRIVDLLKRAPKIEENGVIGGLVAGEELFREIEALLRKTDEITLRNKEMFQTTTGF